MATSTNGASIPEKARVMLEDNYPEVDAATNYHISKDELVYDKKNFRIDVISTDESFFKVFSIDFITGIPEGIFDDPYNAVITESCVSRIFGDTNPIGEIVNVSHREDLKIVAIVKDFPDKTCLHGELFCNSDLKIRYSSSGHNGVRVYLFKMFVRLVPGVDAAGFSESVSPEIQKFMDWIDTDYYLEKFTDVYFNPDVTYDNLNHANIKLIKLL